MGVGESFAASRPHSMFMLRYVLSCCRSYSGRRSRLRVEPLVPPTCSRTQVCLWVCVLEGQPYVFLVLNF